MGRQPMRHGVPSSTPHRFIGYGAFKKMNTKIDRQALPEDELAWIENIMPVGPNKLQTVPAALAPISNLTANRTTKTSYGVSIGTTDYIIIFTNGGAGVAINAVTGAQVTFAPDGTFVNPDLTAFASQRILIIDTGASGYSTWDGTLFVKSGGISPNIQVTNGGTYSAAPLVTITGGSGTGATAHAVMGGAGASQFVAQVVLDTPGAGYLPGDTITVAFAPASTTVATARVWPQTNGTTIAVFGGRVWWASAPATPVGSTVRILNFTGTNGYDDTNPANAAGATTITDADLAHFISALRAQNNYLYVFGDNSVRQIGTITVQSSITLFTPFVIASDIGTTFLNTIQSYNRFTMFANKNGVYGIFGASVQKLSDDMDGIFERLDFSQLLSAALNDIHVGLTSGGSIHCYLLLVKYLDPIQGPRPLLLVFDGKQWFVVSQGNIHSICGLPLQTTLQWDIFASFTAIGGDQIGQVLQDNTTAVPVLLITSLSPHGEHQYSKQIFHTALAVNAPVGVQTSMTIQIDTENGSNGYAFASTGGFQLLHHDVEGEGHYVGITYTALIQSTTIHMFMIEYAPDGEPWGDLYPPPAVVELTDDAGTHILTTEGGVPLTPG